LLESLLVGIQTVLAQVIAVDLGQPDGEVVAFLFQHPNRRQCLVQRLGLAHQSATDYADGIRVA